MEKVSRLCLEHVEAGEEERIFLQLALHEKAQRKPSETRQRFAPLRLCARNLLLPVLFVQSTLQPFN
jgi:hypothetical protein